MRVKSRGFFVPWDTFLRECATSFHPFKEQWGVVASEDRCKGESGVSESGEMLEKDVAVLFVQRAGSDDMISGLEDRAG